VSRTDTIETARSLIGKRVHVKWLWFTAADLERMEFEEDPHEREGVLTALVVDDRMVELTGESENHWMAVFVDDEWVTFIDETVTIEAVAA
jgi:hypothetical protein